jgi:ankyrin repeat protein
LNNNETIIEAALSGNDNDVQSWLLHDAGIPQRSIHVAAAIADAAAAFAQIEADPSLTNSRGGKRNWTPLLYLCCSRYRRTDSEAADARLRIAIRLIELGADVNAAGLELGYTSPHVNQMFDEHEWRPIDGAAGRLANIELVRLLLDKGADLNITYETLSQAVRGANVDVLNLLLKAGPQDWWQVGWALKACAVLDRPDMARILMSHLRRPRIPETALLEAIRLQRGPGLIDILLGDGGNHSQTQSVWRNIYRAALRYNHSAALEVLRRRGADESAVTDVDRVIAACMNADRAEMRRLLVESSYTKTALQGEDHRMLPWAVRTRRFDAVDLLLEAGLNPNVPDRDGETPLHLAVKSNASQVVDALLQAGALLDVRNFDLETPLDLAVAHVDVKARDVLTSRLVKAGAHPLHDEIQLDTEERNLLFERAADAVVFGDLDKLRELLDEEPLLVHMRSPRPHRATLLHYCGGNGTEDPRQRTPANAPAIAKLLLDRGADVNATCNLYGGGATTMGLLLTSIHPLRAGLRTAMAETLLNAMATIDIVGAASLGRLDLVRKFVNPTKAEIQSAFMSACEFGRTAVVEFLLDNGANLHAQDGNGQTGLHSAALGGHADTVKLLLERHAPLEVQNAWGGTVLGNVLWAAINHDPNVDYVPIVNMLVEAKARVEPEFLTWWRQQNPLVASAKSRIEELLRRALV